MLILGKNYAIYSVPEQKPNKMGKIWRIWYNMVIC